MEVTVNSNLNRNAVVPMEDCVYSHYQLRLQA